MLYLYVEYNYTIRKLITLQFVTLVQLVIVMDGAILQLEAACAIQNIQEKPATFATLISTAQIALFVCT